ncbi:hypothetical protein BJX99DRAFT_254758 [Aspergillus californicus]
MALPKNGGKLAFQVAELLDKAGVPSVLWGWLALALVGSDEGSHEVEFVIPDNKVDTANKALSDAGFKQCLEASCVQLLEYRVPEGIKFGTLSEEERARLRIVMTAWDAHHPVPALHYHVDKSRSDMYPLLSLHKKSSQLWWLPELQLGPPAEDDRNLAMSNSSRLPTGNGRSGPWTGQYPIKVLLPWAFLEAIILLWCRDYKRPSNLHQLWHSMLLFFLSHDEEVRYKIQPQFQEAWGYHRGRLVPPDTNVWIAMKKLRESLVATNQLPDIPPNNSGTLR